MIEFEQDGAQYRTVAILPKIQFHISRRITPLLLPLVPAFNAIVKTKATLGGPLDFLEPLAGLLQPFTEALADMKDEHFDYVYDHCLQALQRQVGDNWMPVVSRSNVVMFEDLKDLGEILPLIIKVLTDSLGPFIQGLLTGQQQTEATMASAA
jgi:hypothetical protein